MSDLLDDQFIKIGKPTPWCDGSGRVSFCIEFRYAMGLRLNFQSRMEEWLKANVSDRHSLMFDFNQGEPFWTVVLQEEEDVTIFLLRFSRVIC